jgi:hypothetical protein
VPSIQIVLAWAQIFSVQGKKSTYVHFFFQLFYNMEVKQEMEIKKEISKQSTQLQAISANTLTSLGIKQEEGDRDPKSCTLKNLTQHQLRLLASSKRKLQLIRHY